MRQHHHIAIKLKADIIAGIYKRLLRYWRTDKLTMDSSTLTTLLVMAVLVILSAYFSATETAFSSLNRVRLKNMSDNGNARAKLVLRLSDNFDKLLSSILVGNNIVNIALTSIATVFFVERLGVNGATVATIVVTLVVLIFGEITPKSLAKESPQRFAMFSAPILNVLIIILTPINFLFTQWKKLVARVFKSKDSDKLTDEELLTIVEEATQDGGIDQQESVLIRNAIVFNDYDAQDILTPRTSIIALESTATKAEIAEAFLSSSYSRLPVYEDTIDRIVGVINHKDFYNHVYHTDKPVLDIIKPVAFVTPSKKIGDIMRLLQRTKSHMAIVSDEYGGMVGLLTIEDILEELVGEIWDEHDVVDEISASFELLAANEYRIQCDAEIDDLFAMLGMNLGETEASTVGGFVTEQLGRIPDEGDKLSYLHLDIIVTKTDARRVQEIVLTVNPNSAANASADIEVDNVATAQ